MVRLWIVPTVAKRVGFPRLNPLNGRIALVTSSQLGWAPSEVLGRVQASSPIRVTRVFEYRGRLYLCWEAQGWGRQWGWGEPRARVDREPHLPGGHRNVILFALIPQFHPPMGPSNIWLDRPEPRQRQHSPRGLHRRSSNSIFAPLWNDLAEELGAQEQRKCSCKVTWFGRKGECEALPIYIQMEAPCVWGEHMIQGPCAPGKPGVVRRLRAWVLRTAAAVRHTPQVLRTAFWAPERLKRSLL